MGTLTLKNIGPIRDVTLEHKRFRVFIGPQASGKSTIVRWEWFFRSLPDILNYAVFQLDQPAASLSDEVLLARVQDSIISHYYRMAQGVTLTPDSTLSYEYSPGVSVSIVNGEQNAGVQMSEGLQAILLKGARSNDGNVLPGQESATLLKRRLGVGEALGLREETVVFIPDERLSLDRLAAHIVPQELGNLDFMLERFVSSFRGVLRAVRNGREIGLSPLWRLAFDSVDLDYVVSKMDRILKGRVVVQSGSSAPQFRLDSGVEIPLTAASSGQRAAAAIPYVMLNHHPDPTLFYIEEPESHLFTTAQRDMMEFIIACCNMRTTEEEGNGGFVITTHSPYIITVLNNMLLRSRVEQGMLGETERRLLTIHDEEFDAYLVSGGECTSIFHDGIINIDHLEQVTVELESEFDQLLALYPARLGAGRQQ